MSTRDMFILKQVFFLALAGSHRRRRSACCRPSGVRRVALAGCAIALVLTALTLVAGVRDQGRAALDRVAGLVAAAERVPQAVLRRGRRVADRGGPARPALPRHAPRVRRFRRDRAAAEIAAGHRHACRRHRRVLHPAFRRRAEPRLFSAWGLAASASPAWPPTSCLRACAQPGDALPQSGRRATTIQVNRALEAFGNGGLLGRGPGEGMVQGHPARTPMPISSSPSPARNSA